MSLKEYYNDYAFSGIYPFMVLHKFGVNGKIAGNLGVVGEIKDAVPIIHGPMGCGYHYRYTSRRKYLPVYKNQCSNLKECDVIFGGEDKLRQAIIDTYKRFNPRLIVVIPSTCSDMINDDISTVIDDINSEIDSKVICIHSETFSHIDKTIMRRNFVERAKNWNRPNNQSNIEYKGCGFVEAMTALVEQVMEKQKIEEKSVNIESFAWGHGCSKKLNSMISIFNEIGIKVNAVIPSCTTEEIIKAPKAQLNIARRVRWAKKMKSKFGTDYFHLANFYSYQGLDGIENFYLGISERLGLTKNANAVLQKYKKQTKEDIKEAQDYLKKYKFALHTNSYAIVPHLIKIYEKNFGVNLKYICVNMENERLKDNDITKETKQTMIANMKKAIDISGGSGELLINPDNKQLESVIKDVDFILDGKELLSKFKDIKVIPDTNLFTPLDFESYRDMVINLAKKVKNSHTRSHLLISKLDYNSAFYPMLGKNDFMAGHEMWNRMWKLKGGII